MEKTVIELTAKTIAKNVLFFEPMDPAMALLLADVSPENPKADLSFNYDYEKEGELYFLFHIDTGLAVRPLAEIWTRTTFKLAYGGKFADLFVPDALDPMNKIAFEICDGAFKQRCKEHGINFTGTINYTPDDISRFTEIMIEQYHKSRKRDDEHNRRMIEQQFLGFTQGKMTRLLINGTIMIMDEVLWLNPSFNRRHNREVFPVPMPVYNTLKMKCLKLENEDVQLNLYHSAFFLLCLDCALTLLFSDYSGLLTERLAANGLTEEKEKEYIKYASDYFKNVEASLKKNKATISNLENRPDWVALLKTA
jgi:hypothetical protein